MHGEKPGWRVIRKGKVIAIGRSRQEVLASVAADDSQTFSINQGTKP
jgi:hypothetical protein